MSIEHSYDDLVDLETKINLFYTVKDFKQSMKEFYNAVLNSRAAIGEVCPVCLEKHGKDEKFYHRESSEKIKELSIEIDSIINKILPIRSQISKIEKSIQENENGE